MNSQSENNKELREKKPERIASLNGLVYKSTGSWYLLRDDSGVFWKARIKGKLKIDDEISSTNPVAVGDNVLFEVEDETEKTGMITEIHDRNNYITRVSPHNKNLKHIIASNIDVALIIATLAEPRTSTGFIDRFLITAEAYHIKAIIVINKTDLLELKHQQQLAHWQNMYENAGYEVYPVVALRPETLEPLQLALKGRTTLFSGHSGVGKSSLINELLPDIALKTKEVSGWSGKGQHTTTFAEMFDLPDGGRIIDTPGVKEFGLTDIAQDELSQYFPEIRSIMTYCRFKNCLHINEPGCAVKEAVAGNLMSADRYQSYLAILESIEKKW